MTDLEQVYRDAYAYDWDIETEGYAPAPSAAQMLRDNPWTVVLAAAGMGFALGLALTPHSWPKPTPRSRSHYREHDTRVIPEGGPESREAIAADALNP